MDTNQHLQPASASNIAASTTAIPPSAVSPTVATLVFRDEFAQLESLYRDANNHSPQFSIQDLVSACVTQVFQEENAAQRIFKFMHTQLLLRDMDSPRHAAALWRQQYELLLALQRSACNRHPNPNFSLDHFTTACVHLALEREQARQLIFNHARLNTVRRASAAA